MKRFLEAFFMILIWLAIMKGIDIILQCFVHEIAVQNILTVVAAFIAAILSAWFSERIVKLIKKYL